MSNKVIILLFAVLLAKGGQAQTYEIRAVNKGGGFVGVEMRITAGTAPTTADFVTDLVFGLKWQSTYNVDLLNTLTTNFHVVKSDIRKTKGAFHYQAFSASITPFLFPADWALNGWVELLSVRNTLTGIGTGTFEVAETGFDITTEPNLGVSLTDVTPTVVASATLVALPVNLVKFEAQAQQSSILVSWVTDHEENAKSFDIERADERNSADFKRVATLPAKGANGGTYEWTDKNVMGGLKYYYRLKQIDLDERYRYSEIRTASLDDVTNTSVKLMPNPVDKELRVVLGGTIREEQLLIKITDARGRVVMVKDYKLSTGRKLTMSAVALMQGQYFLTVESGKSVLAVKPFFKQ
ncbi:T9SS type A sorting domain-containing protein [Paraflavitalea sp. CAU 1676]|uniref:T9SS type A sorting domain-containing protein n=1 Tax=Paraflavitalea sp. CAU 1676 TaxID=3032598 RepID=UPI0023DA08AE|nr:T9SS type A sorting domain-containing protein [Paraflavitalea sp. CAU 1676]MDF2188547.1 T9SS type A sorting domain-containing protein [Paraflavitalea sp. CAU 1676]